MKLLILLLNIVPTRINSTDINTQGSFFPSSNEQKFFRYYFTVYRNVEIEPEPFENIPIFPFTSISIIVLDTKLLFEEQSKLVELDKCFSTLCSELDWENQQFDIKFSPLMKSKLDNQYKLAKLFTAGFRFVGPDSKWDNFMTDMVYENVALNKLREQLEIYIPKRAIKAYDIEFTNYEYYFKLWGSFVKSSTGPQKKIFRGWLDLHFLIPYSQEFFKDTKRGLLVALESLKNRPNQEEDKILKATELEARFRAQEFNRTSYFEFKISRPIEIEKTANRLGEPSYHMCFQDTELNSYGESRAGLEFIFRNHLLQEEKHPIKKKCCVSLVTIGLERKHDIEEINSFLDEYFETTSSDTTTSRSDTTKLRYRKGTMVISLALFLCLGIAIFSLGYYYRKKVKNCSGRDYKKQQGRKKLKLGK